MRLAAAVVVLVVGAAIAACAPEGIAESSGGWPEPSQAASEPTGPFGSGEEPSPTWPEPSQAAQGPTLGSCAELAGRRTSAVTKPADARPKYSIEDLGVPAEAFESVALNSAGEVAGTRYPDSGAVAFVWVPRTGLRDLGPRTSASAINDAGQVAGIMWIGSGGVSHPFRWDPDTGLRDLGLPAGASQSTEPPTSSVSALNDQGQVVGYVTKWSDEEDPLDQAFLWDPETGFAAFGRWGESKAADLNNQGQVVGTDWVEAGDDGGEHAFLWSPGTQPQDLGEVWDEEVWINGPGQVLAAIALESGGRCPFRWDPRTGIRSYLGAGGASAINDVGDVAGALSYADGTSEAFLWNADTGMTHLGTLPGGDWSSAADVNEHGQVVGESGRSGEDGWRHAFIWGPDTGMVDLGVLKKGDSSRAIAVNDRGQAAGWSGKMDERAELAFGRVVLWTPR